MICYLRDVFEEGSFETKFIAGQEVRVIKADGGASAGVPGAADAMKISSMVNQGVTDLINRGYIDKLVFAIKDKETGEPIEQYLFQYKSNVSSLNVAYTNAGDKTKNKNITAKYHPKQVFKRIVRSLTALTETLDNLPSATQCQVFVTYKPDAPQDYKPAYFSEFQGDRKDLQFSAGSAVSMSFGQLKTAFHELSFRLRVREDKFGEEDENEEVAKTTKEEKQATKEEKQAVNKHGTRNDNSRRRVRKKGTAHGSAISFLAPSSVPVAQMSKKDHKRSPPSPPKLNRHPKNGFQKKKRQSSKYPCERAGKRARAARNTYHCTVPNSDDDFTDTDDRRTLKKRS